MRLVTLVLAAVAATCSTTEDAGFREERLFPKDGLLFVRDAAQTRLTIETVPSSCVVVESSLPPCRGMRGLMLQPSPTIRLEITEAPRVLSWRTEEPVQKVQQSQSLFPSKADIADALSRWGAYFGVPPLVATRVHEADMTRRVHDPNVMVTFSVVGCRPTRLPFQLPQCPKKGPTVSVQDPQGDTSGLSSTEVVVESSD